jgi:glycosyltransferase involved in cell wall biosynthesis
MIRTPADEAAIGRYRRAMRRLARRPWGKRRDVLFLGCFAHEPNADGVHWFVRAVWPLLLARGFRDRFVIAGSNIPPHIEALESDRIKPIGYVPDLAPLFRSKRLSVAPLRFGAGIKGKVLASISRRVPVVATGVAVEGMGLSTGSDVMVANDPEAMADAIMRAYTEPALWSRLSESGFNAFRRLFSTEEMGSHLLKVVDSVIESKPAGAAERRAALMLGLLGLLAFDPLADPDFDQRKGHGPLQHGIVEPAQAKA